MKAIKCEMCDSSNIIKKDGFYVCENCGTKYTVEEAKKLLIDGVVTVAIDTSKKEKDLIKIIETANSAGNYQEVYDNASKLVEMNPDLWQGWFYKGVGTGYLAEHDIGRFTESMEYFDQASETCDEEEQEEVDSAINDAIIEIIKYLHTMLCITFKTNIDDDSSFDVDYFFKLALTYIDSLVEEDTYSYCKAYELKTKLIHEYYDALQAAKNNSDSRFGNTKSQKTDDKFGVWVDEQISIAENLKELIKSDIRPQDYEPMLRFYVRVVKDRMDGCSYVYFDGSYQRSLYLAPSAKELAKQDIKELVAAKKEILDAANEREQRYHEERNKEFWNEHKEEKEKLLNKKEELSNSIKPIDEEINDIDFAISEQKKMLSVHLDEEIKVIETRRSIEAVKQKLKGYSLFDVKGKKPHKEELEALKTQLKQEEIKAQSARSKYNSSINREIANLRAHKEELLKEKEAINKKISGINTELTKDR